MLTVSPGSPTTQGHQLQEAKVRPHEPAPPQEEAEVNQKTAQVGATGISLLDAASGIFFSGIVESQGQTGMVSCVGLALYFGSLHTI